jgi:hypothetical protein
MPTPTSTTARSPKRSTTKTSTAKAAAPKSEKSKPRPSDVAAPMIDPDHRRALIAEQAYLIAERRNFGPGNEVEDWLAAEAAVDTALTLGVTPSR